GLRAPTDLGGQVDSLVGDAPLEPVDVAAGAAHPTGAGDDQGSNRGPSGARGMMRCGSGAGAGSQAAAVVNSPMSSGLIALRASGRFSVSIPIWPFTPLSILSSPGGSDASAS